MALGVPVLSTNCSGMPEVIVDGQNGFLVPVRSPKAIVEKILMISEFDPKEMVEIINNAKKTIKNEHLISYQIKKMVEFYEQLLKG